MEKNTIILDELGNEIGRTYPKRARGLVKNGRAICVDDCTIRLCNTHDPASIDNIMEDEDMSKIISFNSRDFRLDKTYTGEGSASRMFITDMFGESVEIYELTEDKQIYSDMMLEANEDYTFRFALVGDYSNSYEVMQFMVVPFAGESLTEDDWDDRYVFNLAQCQYKPELNKRWGNSSVRIYQIPFKTTESGKVRLVFLEKNSVARLFPVKENEAYAQFTEYTMAGWINEKKDQFDKLKDKEININVDQTVRDITEVLKNTVGKIKESVPNFTVVKNNSVAGNTNTDTYKSNEDFDGNELAVILNNVSDGSNVEFSNCNIADVENVIDCGRAVFGTNFEVSNVNIGGKSFCGVMQKIGDGCNVDISNTNISRVNGEVIINSIALHGCNIEVTNTNLSEAALMYLIQKVGDGCNVEISNTYVDPDNSDIDFGPVVNGVCIEVSNSSIPETVREKIKAKMGLGCNIEGL